MIEQDGWTLLAMPDGTMLDLFEPDSELIPTYGLNDGIVFGFRVDDIEAASAELEAAGLEVLCEIHRIPEMNYAYCHFRGPDGRVYGINEQKQPDRSPDGRQGGDRLGAPQSHRFTILR